MYCVNCGKKLEDDWKKCPYCGEEIKLDDVQQEEISKDNNATMFSGENVKYESDSEEKVFHLFAARRTGKLTFKEIPTEIKVSGSNVKVKVLSWRKEYNYEFTKEDIIQIKFGIEPEWTVSDFVRIIIMGLLLFITYGLSIVGTAFFVQIACTQHIRLYLKDGTCVKIPICQKADALDLLREMGYPEDDILAIEKKKISNKAWTIREWIITIIWLLVAAFAICFGIERFSERNNSVEYIEEDIQEPVKEYDLSEIDMETVIGKSIKEMEKMGFITDDSELQASNGEITVGYDDDGKVDLVIIEGDNNNAPAFHGVRLGDTKEDAMKILEDAYTALEDDGGVGFVRLNKDTNEAVICSCEENIVNQISYMVFSDDELENFKEVVDPSEYIFPDSDSKYLSEDEVRQVTVDKLKIGRNEIYARHGVVFESEELQTYFKERSWYKEKISFNDFNADAELNDFEKKNVELIKKVEGEINGTSNEEQAVLNEAYNSVADKTFHMVDTQIFVEFHSGNEFVVMDYYGMDENLYTTYSFSTEYVLHQDVWQYLTNVTIDGVTYYFRTFTDGKISLEGDGEFSGWYEPY
ncbi:YARHG domain-containing protein [Bariatricus sp. SGI.161]|uniref:YARHG domain-containing protein n=1 Tax=Bariatricus sp. SGI.161 TaxID=3420550 RepID=UPI003CFD2463